jgi:hypothetical protein
LPGQAQEKEASFPFTPRIYVALPEGMFKGGDKRSQARLSTPLKGQPSSINFSAYKPL